MDGCKFRAQLVQGLEFGEVLTRRRALADLRYVKRGLKGIMQVSRKGSMGYF